MSHCLAKLHAAPMGTVRRLLLPLMAIASLSGCLTQPAKQEAKPVPLATSAAPLIAVAPEVRSDFDAAMVRMHAEEYKQGIELLDKVIARAPKLAVPYVNRGIAQVKLGELKAAEDDFKHALQLDPGNPVANNEYALLYRKTGRFADARKLYESLLARYPYYPTVHKNLGILCDLYLRDYDCALREYELYSGAAPEDKTIKIWIADVQRRLGK